VIIPTVWRLLIEPALYSCEKALQNFKAVGLQVLGLGFKRKNRIENAKMIW